MRIHISAPPVYFSLMLLLSGIFHIKLKTISIPQPYSYAGFFLIVFGMFLILSVYLLFILHKTTIWPHGKPSSLVRTWPFSMSRNPIYLGLAIILTGVAIISNSLISFITPVLFIMIIERLFIPMEERNLEKAFGKDFIRYKRSVRRWI